MLNAENKKQLWIPAGFAHGFLTLSKTADLLYKATEYYEPNMNAALLGTIRTSALSGQCPVSRFFRTRMLKERVF